MTAISVITRARFDQGDGPSRTYYCNVRLGNGTTLTVENEGQTGRSVQVTYDPRGKTDPQFGNRPRHRTHARWRHPGACWSSASS
ncbi:hypothetical protein ACFY1U_16220 [Streptomyces sp. NPDC001351]|uniref:hypothetical protein n=1 Tax=Streptomyces sp. NPDC001351 TaxID=3364564 RepID=UPI0036AE8110